MARLKNKLPHMAGQSVKVNGVAYQLDSQGVVDIPDQGAVDKLLSNTAAWVLASSKPKVKPKKTAAPTPAKKVVRKPVVEEEKTKPKKEEKQAAVEIDDGENDWPDPTPAMSIAYLRQMADAYPSVNYTIKTPKGELIKRIRQAMYDTAE